MYHTKRIGQPWLLLTLLTRSLCQLVSFYSPFSSFIYENFNFISEKSCYGEFRDPTFRNIQKRITCQAKYLVTTGFGKDLLRGQVKTLLQKVEEVLFYRFDMNM
ncbi:hypothetical protein R3W88_029397 [Solanum pinnatisectum]|uniref:Uncharacterized protein n=1 Tax=Solanum pinnatisectum TaxID=50273 RepID=A0AAV9K5E4_9SOLN|nr:hypothetical protein R3W88_029397 [Solanum pinnatisectum]